MLNLRAEIEAGLAAAGCRPLHRFGQNFMVDGRVLAALIEQLAPLAGARIAEVGPGTGVLTRRLIEAGAQVLAIEIDRGLAAHLERTLGPQGLTLVHGDVLESKSRLHPALVAWAAEPWLLGANLPYDVAIPVVLECVALPRPPDRVAVTVQYECARRLASRPGDDAWGASAAVLQAAGTPRLVRRIGRDAFFPQPNIDSAILAWTPTAPLPPGFGAWCRALFAYRRKVLPRGLMDLGHTRDIAEAACAATGLDPQRRVENLDAPELTTLYASLPCAPAAS